MKRTVKVVLAALALAAVMVRPSGAPSGDPASGGHAPRSILIETDWNDYIWPTDAGRTQSSNFAEFRRAHFHAGIDVSTRRRTGWKVFTMRDGEVYSIQFEPFGYGWYLVLRHPDGFYTAYAHLKRVSSKLWKALLARMEKEHRSFGFFRFAPGEVTVKKGEVVAFTGATGAGPAHLHFEVRDRNFNPVNPGLAPNLRVVDSIAPVFRELVVEPLGALSAVNGKRDRAFIGVAQESGSRYRLSKTPVVRGDAGLLVKAYDRAVGAQGSWTPYLLELYVDTVRVFAARFDRFQDSLYWSIRIDRAHDLMLKRKGEYRKLYREPGNSLAVYETREDWAGRISFTRFGYGRKRIRVHAEDLEGNSADLTGEIVIVPPMEFRISAEGENATIIRIADLEQFGKFVLDRRRFDSSGWENVRTWKRDELKNVLRVENRSLPEGLLRLRAFDPLGNAGNPVYFAHGTRNASGRLQVHRRIEWDEIIYTITASEAFDQAPTVEVIQGGNRLMAKVSALAPDTYLAVAKAWPGFAGKAMVNIRAVFGGLISSAADSLNAVLVTPWSGGQLVSDDHRFLLRFPPGAVTRPMLCRVQTVRGDRGASYRVEPQGVPIPGRPVAVFSIPDSITDTSSLFIRMDDAGASPRWTRPVIDAKAGTVSMVMGKYLGTYSLGFDREGPVLTSLALNRRKKRVWFKLNDYATGLDWNSVSVRIDGKQVPVEFNERRQRFYVPDKYFPRRASLLGIAGADRLGNIRSWEKKFR